jgi:ribose transport system substrate-binding protein
MWRKWFTVFLAFALVLSACSKDNGTTTPAENVSSGPTEAVESGSAAVDLTEIEERMEKLSQKPEFVFDGEPFDAKALVQGKKILSIPTNSAIPYSQILSATQGVISEEIGVEVFTWENQGKAVEYIQGIEHAINSGYDLIDLSGVDPKSLTAQIAQAQEAGIKVVTTHVTSLGETLESVDYSAPQDFAMAARLLADWTILKGGQDVNVLVVKESDLSCSLTMVEAMKEEYATYAPNAKVKYVDVPIADWATKIQTEVQNALIADPDIDYVIAIYDSMLQYVVPAIQISGNTGKVKTIGFNGTPFVLDMVREGSVEMVVGESIEWLAYGYLDYEMRVLAGLDVPADEAFQFYIWTKDNVEDAGIPADATKGYGDSYIKGYRELWKLD